MIHKLVLPWQRHFETTLFFRALTMFCSSWEVCSRHIVWSTITLRDLPTLKSVLGLEEFTSLTVSLQRALSGWSAEEESAVTWKPTSSLYILGGWNCWLFALFSCSTVLLQFYIWSAACSFERGTWTYLKQLIDKQNRVGNKLLPIDSSHPLHSTIDKRHETLGSL